MSESEIRRELAEVEARLAAALSAVERLQGWRDRLLLKLLDSEGLHDRQPAGVR